MEIPGAEYVTTQEVEGFISDLFKSPNPKCDPAWSGTISLANLPDDVEFATQEEVDSFITGLFKK